MLFKVQTTYICRHKYGIYTHTHTHTHKNTHTHAHTHIHMHAYTHKYVNKMAGYSAKIHTHNYYNRLGQCMMHSCQVHRISQEMTVKLLPSN